MKKQDYALHHSDRLNGPLRLKVKQIGKWRWCDEHGRLALSVNCLTCCHNDPEKSVKLADVPADFCAVWVIDLGVLNSRLGHLDNLYADHAPIVGNGAQKANQCHYEIKSNDHALTADEIILIINTAEEFVPPLNAKHPKKFPVAHEVQANNAILNYQDLVMIHEYLGQA